MAGKYEYEWDSGNIGHATRHGVTVAEIEEVMENNPTFLQSYRRGGEERERYIGVTDAGRIVEVAATLRGGRYRVIAAFPAKKRRRSLYRGQ